MNRTLRTPLGLLGLLALAAAPGDARADDDDDDTPVPDYVTPFVSENAHEVKTVTGPFGPAKATTIVVTYSLLGREGFAGFALVPDRRASHGYRRLALPRMRYESYVGGIRFPVVANLDKDPDDELVIELATMRVAGGPTDGYSYGMGEYIVLDWNGKQFVRLARLEKKLVAKLAEGPRQWLTATEIRAALALPALVASPPPPPAPPKPAPPPPKPAKP